MTFINFHGCKFPFLMSQAIFFLGYKVITMIIALVTTKEKSLGTNFNQENCMLVIWLVLPNLYKNGTQRVNGNTTFLIRVLHTFVN